MKQWHKVKLKSFKRYKAVLRLNHFLKEKEVLGEDQEVIGKEYYYDFLELPYRSEFAQEAEYDETGDLLVQDYVIEHYTELVEEAQALELSNMKEAKRKELKAVRDNKREEFVTLSNGHLQSIEREDSHDLTAKLKVAQQNGGALWKHGDNNVGVRDAQYMENMALEVNTLVDNLFIAEGYVGAQIDGSNSVEELCSINLKERFLEEYIKI